MFRLEGVQREFTHMLKNYEYSLKKMFLKKPLKRGKTRY